MSVTTEGYTLTRLRDDAIQVRSPEGRLYRVTLPQLSCSCWGYRRWGHCKHQNYIQEAGMAENGNGAVTTRQGPARAEAFELALVTGDLKGLSPEERVAYYHRVCESLGLNPLTKPFDYLLLNNKLVLYALRSCTDQLRKLNCISVLAVTEKEADGILQVTARLKDKDGREDEDIGCVNVGGLKGEALANARMKAVTKAKRRATLSICGLGWLDETEVETIPGALVGEPQQMQEVPRLPEPRISAEQQKELNTLFEERDADMAQLCAFYHVAALAGLPASKFQKVKDWLLSKPQRDEPDEPDQMEADDVPQK